MSWVAQYIGKPFRDGGRGPDAYDCWGCVVAIYRDHLDIVLPDYGEISAADLLRVRRQIGADAALEPWRKMTSPREFDVCVMRLPSGRSHGHVGVMTDERHVLHAEAGSGVAVEPVDGPTIRGRIMGFWRHA